ncbi:MAG: fibronectin type III domain-containing protein [Leptospiraceae bacterium]|nr:fibronectin type III domain-containing protein [Leptospiraceae bacterium]
MIIRYVTLGVFKTLFLFLFVVFLIENCSGVNKDLLNLILASNLASRSLLDTETPKPGNSGTITISDLNTTSLKLSWTLAVDNSTPQEKLEYRIVQSTSNNISSVSDMETNVVILQDWKANIASLQVSNLTANTIYYFNITVKDTSGNKSAYTTVSIPDTLSPTVGNNGSITITHLKATSLTLNWTKSSDLGTLTNSLQYKVVQSTSDNISTVLEMETTGSGRSTIQDWAVDINTKDVTGLTVSTTYYFNVLVKDQAGNKTIYSRLVITTLDIYDNENGTISCVSRN